METLLAHMHPFQTLHYSSADDGSNERQWMDAFIFMEISMRECHERCQQPGKIKLNLGICIFFSSKL